jgi:hypothetical protein
MDKILLGLMSVGLYSIPVMVLCLFGFEVSQAIGITIAAFLVWVIADGLHEVKKNRRGHLVSSYFEKLLETIFGVNTSQINNIGDDNFSSAETFKRTPKADIEIKFRENDILRIEVQSGFTGINDIKQHKVLEARRVFLEKKLKTIVMHYDFYNGQVAFVEIYNIEDNNIFWVTRQQKEGQTVFNIDQNYFVWRLIDAPPLFSELESFIYE